MAHRRFVAGLLAVGLALLGLALPGTASADTRPAPGTPATVSADALGTVQVNGVVWSMTTVNGIVYATGRFTTARPSGAAAGTGSVARANLVAFDLATGALTAFNHTLNGQGRTIVASPDGSRVYVGGDFTTVDGIAHGHVAAFSTATGALVGTFSPTTNNAVYALAATAGTVYAGGAFTTAGGATRTRLAAFSATTGAVTPWAPTANRTVRGVVVTPSATRVVFAGDFDSVSGTAASSLASVDLTGGDVRTWGFGIDNGTDQSGMWSLKTDGTNVYATAWGYLQGNIEGVIAVNPDTLGLVWMSDCHGDNYDSFVTAGVLYATGHSHDCSTSGSYPDPRPRDWKRVIAMTTAVTGTLSPTTDTPRYASWTGNPHPQVLDWFPTVPAGTFTGQNQGAWSVTGSGKYVVFGGEFTSVNGTAQQALVRFTTPDQAPNRRGPELTSTQLRPNALSTSGGSVTVTWPSSWDMDNENLTYTLTRTGTATPVYTVTSPSAWWKRPALHYTDTLPPGTTASYTVSVADPFGNRVTSAVSNTVTVGSGTSAYANQVLADNPDQYWRLGEPSGGTAYDYVGTTNLVEQAGIGHAATGAVPGDGSASTSGTAAGIAVTNARLQTPWRTFSIEAWVRTTGSGVVVQYGDSAGGANTLTDRTLYVDAHGRPEFGVSYRMPPPAPGQPSVTGHRSIVGTTPVADGSWHHLVATLGGAGTTLYVDGAAAANDPTMTSADGGFNNAYYAQVGSGVLTGWPDAPASPALAGAVDEVALYPTTLGSAQVAQHRALATGGPVDAAPTASFTATPGAGTDVAVDGTGSSDPDGTIASWSWNWGDGTPAGTGATATHTYAAGGAHTITLTVTDNGGATGTSSRTVTAGTPANTPPTAAFTSTATGLAAAFDGSGSSDPGGSIGSWSWDFGDGAAAGTGPTPSHTYPAGGTYTVTLTVTDGGGATGTVSHPVTVAAPSTAFASDAFNRTVTNGLGTADVGGAWTLLNGPTRQTIPVPGAAVENLTAAGSLDEAVLGSVSRPDADVSAGVTLNQAPTGGGANLWLVGRRTGANEEYRLRLRFLPDRTVRVAVTKLDGSASEVLVGTEVTLAGITYTPGTPVNARFSVSGTAPATLLGKVWAGTTEPTAWTVSRTDSGSAALQGPGAVGMAAYLSGSATAAPVSFSVRSFSARPVA